MGGRYVVYILHAFGAPNREESYLLLKGGQHCLAPPQAALNTPFPEDGIPGRKDAYMNSVVFERQKVTVSQGQKKITVTKAVKHAAQALARPL